ncbi:membrane-spanning 4-domains subfamily A member 12-like isoform X2 [Dendropsophus ebraccatus]|uniref:membrane-spanning 4-domains subfamily A member 12-like isoform X2 n=1 Tax=Dendropsophus ebraccatus TaxID=150705 RepID=UPI003831BA90
MSQLPGPVPASTMYENSAIQNQAPTAVSNLNTQVPPFLQNASLPLPAYSVSPSAQVLTAAPQWSTTRIVAPNTSHSSPFYQTFLKGRPKALGIVLIVSAIFEIALGIGQVITASNITAPSGISFWGPIFYIIAGSLTIAAQSKPNLCLVRGSLSLNIISSILSIVAVILNAIDAATVRCYYYLSGSYYGSNIYGSYNYGSLCREKLVFLIQNDVVVSMNPSTQPDTFSGFSQPFPTANPPPPPPYAVHVKSTPVP